MVTNEWYQQQSDWEKSCFLFLLEHLYLSILCPQRAHLTITVSVNVCTCKICLAIVYQSELHLPWEKDTRGRREAWDGSINPKRRTVNIQILNNPAILTDVLGYITCSDQLQKQQVTGSHFLWSDLLERSRKEENLKPLLSWLLSYSVSTTKHLLLMALFLTAAQNWIIMILSWYLFIFSKCISSWYI